MKLHPWHGLFALLGWNYARHKLHLSTLCSSGREHITPLQFCVGWGLLSTWLIPHFCRWKIFRRSA